MSDTTFDNRRLLPEWSDFDVDEAAFVAALEASRLAQFAELADL